MKNRKKQRHPHKKPGLPPGSLVYIGEQKEEPVKMTILAYNEHTYTEKTYEYVDRLPAIDEKMVTWINVSGIHDVKLVQAIGKSFHIHPLLLEDILNSEHRPKLTYFNDQLLLILKRFDFDVNEREVKDEQISCILNKNVVITFQENETDDFDQIRDQIRKSIGDVRMLGTDFLFYRLIDHTVDHYLTDMELIYDQIEILEEEMVMKPSEKLLHRIYEYKTEVIKLRKLTWPLKEAITKLEKREIPLISKMTQFYFSDILEHLDLADDMVDTMRTQLTSLLDVYFSSVSTRMNEIMKVLTMVSTIFIPLTFLAGIYGMNFEFMPELHWKIGYPLLIAVMAILTISMLIYFRKKKWL